MTTFDDMWFGENDICSCFGNVKLGELTYVLVFAFYSIWKKFSMSDLVWLRIGIRNTNKGDEDKLMDSTYIWPRQRHLLIGLGLEREKEGCPEQWKYNTLANIWCFSDALCKISP